ncbi:MAG: hypothetical protein MRJ65_04885 [Candidatus Brocadiaceae bacterium]|nr:hypothetical protein [Candidatus Brocadiaceae bacterium]
MMKKKNVWFFLLGGIFAIALAIPPLLHAEQIEEEMSDVALYEESGGDAGSEMALDEQTGQETGDVTAEVVECNTESEVVVDEESEPIPLSYGDHTNGASISPAVDTDSFRFVGSAGDVVRFHVSGLTGIFDPRLEVWDPGFNKIVDKYCSCTFIEEITLPATGTYTIIVSDSGVDETGDYLLQLERIPPVFDPPFIAYNAIASCVISPGTDLDFFTFEGTEGCVIRINIRSPNGYFDSRLEVWDPDNTRIVDKHCNASANGGCSFSEDIALPLSGTYLLAMSDYDVHSPGNYEISINCIVGDCCGDVTIRHYKEVVSLPDISGNNLPETASLVMTNGAVQALIRDANNQYASGMWFFPDNFRAVSMASVPDMNLNNSYELAVLVVNKTSDGAIIKIRDALTKEILNTFWVLNTAIWKPVSLTSIPDMNGNNIPELVIVAVNMETKAVVGHIRDALTKENLGIINYPPSVSFSP